MSALPAIGLAGAAGLATGDWLGGLAKNFGGRFGNRALGQQVEREWEAVRTMGNPIERENRRKRLEQALEMNHMALASMAPHLYAEVLAGRRLPKGAVVVGGRPRTDLLDGVLGAMVEGGEGAAGGI